MSEWKHRDLVSKAYEAYMFSEQIENMLDADRDVLLEIIEYFINRRNAAIEREKAFGKSVDSLS